MFAVSCPMSQRDVPDTSEGAILDLLTKWHNHIFWSKTPIRSKTEQGTLAVLVPFDPQTSPIRIPLYMSHKSIFRIGSADVNASGNEFAIKGPNISPEHCVFSWDPSEGFGSLVQITDRSACNILVCTSFRFDESLVTFFPQVNDERMSYKSSVYLQDQDIITFAPKDSRFCPDFRELQLLCCPLYVERFMPCLGYVFRYAQYMPRVKEIAVQPQVAPLPT